MRGLSILTLLLALLVTSCKQTSSQNVELEVYTLEDILYVDPIEFTITSESGLIDKKFNSGAELKEYLSDVTALHNQL